MELVRVVRIVWRRRLWLAAGLVVAGVLALLGGRTSPTSSGVAFTRVALDTPTSVLVDTTPAGGTTLAWRAALLAHLVAGDDQRRAIAARLGIPPGQLAVVDPELAVPGVPSSIPKSISEALVATAPYVLNVSLPNGGLPIISVEAFAPTRAAAARLARAATGHLTSESSGPDGPGVQPFVLERAAPVHARTVVNDSGPLRTVAVFVFLFGLWTVAVTLGPPALRRLRLRPRPDVADRKPGPRRAVA
jgi:hypothetical protein